NKILPNFKISRFYHLKIQGKLFTIFRLTRSKNIWMDFIECEKVYSSFKDDQFYLQKKEPTYFNENIEYKLSNIKIGKRNLLKFECIELENQINFFLNDGHISIITILFAVRWDGTPQIQEQCSDLTFQARLKKKLTRRNPDETKKSSFFINHFSYPKF
ncbi:hypothetical protein BpHYR1_005219, partial [Brachionus plicatilis]